MASDGSKSRGSKNDLRMNVGVEKVGSKGNAIKQQYNYHDDRMSDNDKEDEADEEEEEDSMKGLKRNCVSQCNVDIEKSIVTNKIQVHRF